MGYDTTNVTLNLENSANFVVSGGRFGILQVSPQTAAHIGGALTFDEMADPSNPLEGDGVLWVTTAGELKYKTTQGGVTTTKTVATIP